MMKPFIPALPCMCASLRRASRLMSQFYEDAMRPLGMRATQFTILQSLALAGEVTQGQLGQMLGMDSTTLTRTLTIMSREGWIAKRRGEDRREWRMRLSKKGEAQFKIALPHWQKVQDKLRGQLGNRLSDNLMTLTNEVTKSLTE
jgi:DNA-binding MarR family transcriptional regulator